MFHMLAKNFSQYFDIYSYIPQKIGCGISCKLSPKETICMKCHTLFSGKKSDKTSVCGLLNLPRQSNGYL